MNDELRVGGLELRIQQDRKASRLSQLIIFKSQLKSGFTLVEALIAAVILVIGIAGALAAISAGLRAQTVADYYQTAGWLLQEKLAELEAAPQLTAGRQNGVFDEPAGYRWLSEISEGPEGLWLATVQVEEPQGKINPRQSEITTYLLRR